MFLIEAVVLAKSGRALPIKRDPLSLLANQETLTSLGVDVNALLPSWDLEILEQILNQPTNARMPADLLALIDQT